MVLPNLVHFIVMFHWQNRDERQPNCITERRLSSTNTDIKSVPMLVIVIIQH